jgi:hypothetical protein
LHIVASYRAKVNDSEPVDALGKVEIEKLKTQRFLGAEKLERGIKNRAAIRAYANVQKKNRPNAAAYSSFFTVTFTFAPISRCSFTGISYSPTTLMGSASVILRLSM